MKILIVIAILSILKCSPLATDPISSVVPDPITYNFLQGNLQCTGRLLDLGIEGDGFFILKKGSDYLYYRRPGSFFQDKDGYFVLAFNDIRLQGIPLDDTDISNNPSANDLVDIKIPISLTDKPKATTKVTLACNLDYGPERTGARLSIYVYDHKGATHIMVIDFMTTQEPDRWNWSISMADDAVVLSGNNGYIQFRSDGSPDTVVYNNNPVNEFAFSPRNTTDAVRIFLDMGHKGGYTGLTNFISSTTATARERDGHAEGVLREISIEEKGGIFGVFSNGNSRALFQIQIAFFPCREGLKLFDSVYFLETEYSGKPVIDIRNVFIRPGSIELDPF
jgi:flagellar hook protein FlgE